MEQFQHHDPELAAVLSAGDIVALRTFMMKRFMSKHKEGFQKQQELAAIEADPMNEENQKKIEDAIRMQNVQQNMELALENLPE